MIQAGKEQAAQLHPLSQALCCVLSRRKPRCALLLQQIRSLAAACACPQHLLEAVECITRSQQMALQRNRRLLCRYLLLRLPSACSCWRLASSAQGLTLPPHLHGFQSHQGICTIKYQPGIPGPWWPMTAALLQSSFSYTLIPKTCYL